MVNSGGRKKSKRRGKVTVRKAPTDTETMAINKSLLNRKEFINITTAMLEEQKLWKYWFRIEIDKSRPKNGRPAFGCRNNLKVVQLIGAGQIKLSRIFFLKRVFNY